MFFFSRWGAHGREGQLEGGRGGQHVWQLNWRAVVSSLTGETVVAEFSTWRCRDDFSGTQTSSSSTSSDGDSPPCPPPAPLPHTHSQACYEAGM